jgi:NitT/TauT family transport system substrate-binding protein
LKPILPAFFAILLALALPARADDLQKITIATMRITPNAPLLLAREKGYFRDEGLDADIILFESAQDVVLAGSSGAATVSNGGLTAGFYNIASKGGLKIIGAQNREENGYHNNGFMVSTRAFEAGLKTLKDLPGHRVGINASGSTQHYALGLIAQKYGFDMSAVSVVPLQNYSNLVAAFRGGQIDVIIATVNIANQLEAQGVGHTIGWSGDETPWQLGAIYTRPSVIEKQRPLLEHYLKAYLRAAREYNVAFNQLDANGQLTKGPGYDELLPQIARLLEQPEKEIAVSFPYVDPRGAINVGDIYNQIAFWQKQGVVGPGIDAKSLVDLSFVQGSFNIPQ